MSKKTTAVVLSVFGLALALAAGPASAGKTPSASPSIKIATVNGTTTNATALLTSKPSYGSALTFASTNGSLAGNEYPMVALSCYQDVNGDGRVDTSLLGPDIVYAWLDTPTATFPLAGNGWSLWSERGGAATCRADLDAYGWKAGKESIRVMATTGNWSATG